MKKLLIYLLLLFPVLVSGQIKPDFIRTPNGGNTIVDWNLKAKTFILPHYRLYGRPVSQDSTGQIFFSTDTTDKHVYVRQVNGYYLALANVADLSGLTTYKLKNDTVNAQGYARNWQLTNLLAAKQNLLGYTPEDIANKATSFSTISNTLYPSTQAVYNYSVALGGSYTNPSWISSLAWSKITGAPSSFPTPNALTFGYGFTGQPFTFDGSGAVTSKIDSAAIQTVGNFFTLGNTKYYTKTQSDARFAPIAINGTVTNVSSANTDINVATGTTTPVLTLNNINGVTKSYYDPTSSIQTQLNAKAPAVTYTSNTIYKGNGTTTPVVSHITDDGTYIRAWDGTRGIKIGGSSLFGGGMIWDASVGTPNDTNFSLMTQSGSTTLNTTGNMYFGVLGTSYGELNTTGFSIDGVLEATSYPAGLANGTERILVQGTSGGNFGSPIKSIAGNSYTNGSNVPYIVQPDNSTPETTPSALSSSSYRFTPLIKQFKSGKIILAYVDTTGHIAGRTIKVVYSTNGGSTWTTPTVLVISSGVKYQNIGGGVTSTGRFIFAYTKVIGTTTQGVYGIYTDDEGSTWSSEFAIATGLKDAFGSLVVGANNKLMLPIYTEGGTTKSQIVNSTDNGATWSSAVDVSDGISSENEASIAYLGGYMLLADVRQGTPNFFKQYISTDNGVTWVSQGVTTFGGSTQVSPWLDVWFAPSGRRMVTLYYSERSSGYIRAITASGQDLVANGVAAWNTSTLTNVATATTDGNSGYPSVIHPNNSAYALGVFYTGSSSVTAMTFFTYPPTGAQPLIYGSQNVSVGYNVNGININAIYAPIASPTFTGTVTIPTGGVFNTPASLVGTNITGTAAGLTAGTVTTIPNLTGAITSSGNATSLGSFSSANLLAALTTKTGTGNSVFSASPTFTGTSIFSNISPSGALNFTGAGTRPILLNGATTNFQYLEWVSTGAGLLMGINNSAGTSPVPSGSAYSSFWGTENATSADIITNQVARIDVSPTGVVSVLNLTTPGLVVTTTSGGALSTTTALPIGTTAAGTFNLKNYTVATLPAGTRGDIAYVTDALAPSYLVAVVGGGAVVTPVFYDGANWVSH